jgi:hypothetical protein
MPRADQAAVALEAVAGTTAVAMGMVVATAVVAPEMAAATGAAAAQAAVAQVAVAMGVVDRAAVDRQAAALTAAGTATTQPLPVDHLPRVGGPDLLVPEGVPLPAATPVDLLETMAATRR